VFGGQKLIKLEEGGGTKTIIRSADTERDTGPSFDIVLVGGKGHYANWRGDGEVRV